MKHCKHICSLILFISLSFSTLPAQWFNNPIQITPANPLSCDNIQAYWDFVLGCNNYIVSGYGHTISNDTIYLDAFVTGSFICLPALAYITNTYTIGNIPAGNYTMVSTIYLDFIQNDQQIAPITIGSCCVVDASFLASATDVCAGDSINLSASVSGIDSYSWSVDGVPAGNGQQTSVSLAQGGSIDITLTANDGGCIDSTTQTVFVSQPQIMVQQATDESCPNTGDGAIDVEVSGGQGPYSYTWSTGDTTQDLSQLVGGTYGLSLSDNIGCATQATVTLQVGTPPTADFNSANGTLACQGSTISFNNNSTNATSYVWEVDGTVIDTTGLFLHTFSSPGTFQVILTAMNDNCDANATLDVTISAPPSLSGVVTDESCANAGNGGINVSTTGGLMPYVFNWSNNATTEDLNNLSAGRYTVTVMDSLGCIAQDSFSVSTAPQSVFASFSSSTELLCEGNDVSFTNTSTGGTIYEWHNNGVLFAQSTDASLSALSAGTYMITLVASDGVCDDSSSASIMVAAPPTLMASVTHPTCEGNEDGEIDLSLSGGSMPYTFDWSNNATTQDLMNLTAGTYAVTVTDEAQCILLDTFTLAPQGGLTANFGYDFVQNDVQFTDSSDATAVSWLWDLGDGSTSSAQNPLHTYAQNGTYTVCLVATDGFGCSDTVCDAFEFVMEVGIHPDAFTNIHVYPNPASHQCFIELPTLTAPDMQIELFDALGKRVYSVTQVAQKRSAFDLSRLMEGIYHLHVIHGDMHYRAKVVKE